MKRNEVIIREFLLKRKKIITAHELMDICNKYGFDFKKTKIGLLNKYYLLTILRGIYYLKDYNEKKTGIIKYSANELLSVALELKGIKNWYFGMNTALKMLNLTHEIFPVNYILNDNFNRTKPLKIMESRFLFKKIKKPLFFGIEKIITSNNISIKYSNTEKTLLDMAYLYKLSGKSKKPIILLLNEYKNNINKKKLIAYSEKYPKTIINLIYEAFE